MTHKTQPSAHAEITAPISADLRRIDDAGAQPAPITLMTEDRACKWAWDQIREDVGTEGWTTSESCNFYGFFLWGWNYRGQYETQRPAAPPAPAGMVRVADLVSVGNRFYRGNWLSVEGVSELIDAALAASPSAPATVAAPSDALSRAEQNHAALWRQHVGKLDALIAFCPTCSQGFATNAEMTRDEIIFECGKTSGRSGALAAAPAQAMGVPIELQGVQEAVEQGSGFWRSCTGCHELNEGHDTGPVSKVFGCALGNGCSECGGIGAVWDDLDYGAMADAMAAPAQEHATQLAGQGLDDLRSDALQDSAYAAGMLTGWNLCIAGDEATFAKQRGDRMTGAIHALKEASAAAPTQAQAYSIDSDPAGIRARVADAIAGALALGAQGSNTPPPGHWLTPFWMAARFEAAQLNAASELMNAQLDQAQAQEDAREQPRLTVRLTSYPESNGKRNWTALLVRAEKWGGLIGNGGGITVARGELWNRVAYEAERARFLLGHRDTEPFILDYGDDIETPEEWKGENRDAARAAQGGAA